jgi:hypothetical protein
MLTRSTRLLLCNVRLRPGVDSFTMCCALHWYTVLLFFFGGPLAPLLNRTIYHYYYTMYVCTGHMAHVILYNIHITIIRCYVYMRVIWISLKANDIQYTQCIQSVRLRTRSYCHIIIQYTHYYYATSRVRRKESYKVHAWVYQLLHVTIQCAFYVRVMVHNQPYDVARCWSYGRLLALRGSLICVIDYDVHVADCAIVGFAYFVWYA